MLNTCTCADFDCTHKVDNLVLNKREMSLDYLPLTTIVLLLAKYDREPYKREILTTGIIVFISPYIVGNQTTKDSGKTSK